MEQEVELVIIKVTSDKVAQHGVERRQHEPHNWQRKKSGM